MWSTIFFSKKTPDLSLTLTNSNPVPASTHTHFGKNQDFFLAEKNGRPHQKRLLKKMVVHTDEIFSDFHMYVILDNNAVVR